MANKLEHIKIGSETYDIPSGTYSKPNDGIPKTDLASAVQTSLGKADTAIQNVKTINGESIEGTGDITISGGSGANGIDVTLGNPTRPVTMGYKPYMVNLKKDDEYIASAELPEYTATNIIAPMYMSGVPYKAGDYVYYAHHLQKCIADCQDETPLYPYPPNPMKSDYWEVVSVADELGKGGGGGGGGTSNDWKLVATIQSSNTDISIDLYGYTDIMIVTKMEYAYELYHSLILPINLIHSDILKYVDLLYDGQSNKMARYGISRKRFAFNSGTMPTYTYLYARNVTSGSGGGEEGSNVRYNEDRDMVQVYFDGGWNDWQIAGLKAEYPIVKAMINASTPSDYSVNTSSVYSASFAGWMAFDGIIDANNRRWTSANNSKTNQWISIELPQSHIIKKWSIWLGNAGYFKNYELQASKDGVEWVSLGGIHTNDKQVAYTRLDHDLHDNFTSYSRYRVYLYDAVSTSATYLAIGEIQFYGAGEPFNGYLYEYGDEHSTYHGGWTNIGYTRTNYAYIIGQRLSNAVYCNSSNTNFSGIGFGQPFDITEYNILEISFTNVSTELRDMLNGFIGLNRSYDSAELTFSYGSSGKNVEDVVQVDISALRGSQYIWVGCGLGNARAININYIKLIK